MAIVLSGTTNDILVNGVSVATDAEVSSAVASGVAPKANTTDLKEIGVGQTWQDLTASRILGTTYTNSTGKPIEVSAYSNVANVSKQIDMIINGVIVNTHSITGTAVVWGSMIVPPGATYKISMNGDSIYKWSELR